jgi:integrase/recombinase XerD
LNITQAREVTRAVTLSYQSHLFHHKKRDGRPMTVGTQKAMLSAVKGFFSWLTKESHVLYNPASDLEMPRREYRLPKTVLNAGEVETILQVPDVAEPTGLRDRAILETLYSTGIRRAELCGLNLEHIDCDRGLLQIVQGKGKKDRFAPIGERAMHWIEKYLSEGRPALCPAGLGVSPQK